MGSFWPYRHRHLTVITKEVTSVIGGKAQIPCDLTAPFPSDSPHLILFYKDVFGTPIYSFDMRQGENGRHWRDNGTLGNRAYFKFYETGMFSETGAPMIHSFLGIEPLQVQDRGIFRCRVDFREAPTRNTRIKLNLIVPPSHPVILNESGQRLVLATEHVREDSTAVLICETIGGDPLPRLSWWREKTIVDDVVEEVDAKIFKVRNTLRLPNLKRSDHGTTYTCKAFNTNLTAPVETSIKINMVFPPVRAKIVHEWDSFVAGQAYNVSCQVLGSRPPAMTSIFVGSSQLREVNYKMNPMGNVTTTTVIFIPSREDQGKFLSCRAENMHLPNNAVEDQWRVQVHYPPNVSLLVSSAFLAIPSLKNFPDSKDNTVQRGPEATLEIAKDGNLVQIQEGETIRLKCLVEANPRATTIQWFHDGRWFQGPWKSHFGSSSRWRFSSHDDEETIPSCFRNGNRASPFGSSESSSLSSSPRGSSPLSSSLSSQGVGVPEAMVISASLQERIELSCLMDANPRTDIEFRWTLNTSSDRVDIPRAQFSEHGLQSLLTYTAQTQMDFGTIMCLAKNEVGETVDNPCVYHIVPAGKPEKLKNCTTLNQTYESLTIVCQAGFSVGLEQSFILEVYEARSKTMTLNITTNKPAFHIRGLSAGTEYFVEIYAANSKGRSDKTLFETFTLQAAEKQLAATTTELVSNNPMRLLPIIGVLISIVLLLVLLAVIIALVMKNRTSNNNSTTSASNRLRRASSLSTDGASSMCTTSGTILATKTAGSTTHISFNQSLEDEVLIGDISRTPRVDSPDVIPQNAVFCRDSPSDNGGGGSHHGGCSNGPREHLHPESVNFHCYHNGRSEEQQHLLQQQFTQRPTRVEYQPQYVELAFHQNKDSTNSNSGSIVGVSKGRRHPPTDLIHSPHGVNPNQTLYATIDHRNRRVGDDGSHLMHSPNCPVKGGKPFSHVSSTMPRSVGVPRVDVVPSPTSSSLRQGSVTPGGGTLKRVAFRDDVMISSPSSSSGASTQATSSSVIPISSSSSSRSSSAALPRESSFSGQNSRPLAGRVHQMVSGHQTGSPGYSSLSNCDETPYPESSGFSEAIPRSASNHSTNSSVTGGIPAVLPGPPPGYESDQSRASGSDPHQKLLTWYDQTGGKSNAGHHAPRLTCVTFDPSITEKHIQVQSQSDDKSSKRAVNDVESTL
ncbi:hypothetical protein TCAL_04738 [Tigriopus californicus]|uniref:Ig-like domain-containing protein n=1 Tax=Tigriopus californicus TaxID=6832 RepID=A0A553P1V1_TIGCA|nr:hypothetical protein TCAL_04738 [Tigriopus californicus]